MTDIVQGYIYGCRDIKITSLDGATQVDLPASQEITWEEDIVEDSLDGDDVTVAQTAFIKAIDFSLSAGGISLEAYALLTGETVVTAGLTPNRTQTLERHGGKSFPYVKVYGRAIGSSNDGMHLIFPKAKMNSLSGGFSNQSYLVTSGDGKAVADASNVIAKYIKLETDAELPTS